MKNLTFHIVGLTHNDVKGNEVEYAKEDGVSREEFEQALTQI